MLTALSSANNLFTSYKRATGIVMGFIMTNSGGIVSTWLFPTTEAPRYTRGTSVLLAMTIVAIVLSGLNSLWLYRENSKKAKAISRGEEVEIFGKGDRRTDFKYMI